MSKKGKDDAANAELKAKLEAQGVELDRQRRNFVEIAAGSGLAPEDIGLLLVPPIDAETVKRTYALELEMGPAKANLETVQVLRAGVRKGNMTAAIYWTKARMGWTEKGSAPRDQNLAEPEESEHQKPTTFPPDAEMRKVLKIVPK